MLDKYLMMMIKVASSDVCGGLTSEIESHARMTGNKYHPQRMQYRNIEEPLLLRPFNLELT